jgi:hypothetical protein
MNMYLGIIRCRTTNKIINHRSLFKVLFNPIFRMFGFSIGTPYSSEKNKFIGLFEIRTHKPVSYKSSFIYPFDSNTMILEKKRIII